VRTLALAAFNRPPHQGGRLRRALPSVACSGSPIDRPPLRRSVAFLCPYVPVPRSLLPSLPPITVHVLPIDAASGARVHAEKEPDERKVFFETNPDFRTGAIANSVSPKKRTQTNPTGQKGANRSASGVRPCSMPALPKKGRRLWGSDRRAARSPLHRPSRLVADGRTWYAAPARWYKSKTGSAKEIA